jgi:dTDP-4-amino-4,6-dideoxygalactose transaminase
MIPFFDLKQVNEPYLKIFQENLPSFFEKNWYILGEELQSFENNFSKYCGTSYAIGVGNGLDALILILKAYIHLGKLNKGDAVIVPANTFIATILAIKEVGLEPVFIEPNEQTFNINLDEIKKHFNQAVKAIICVHLYGQLSEVEALSQFCDEKNLLFIEDAAQAHGANINGKRAGSFGHAAAFSFYPTKNLGALGDGGCVTTSDEALAKVIKKMRNYGSEKKYVHQMPGVNSRLDDIQALFLSIKLNHLDSDNQKRQAIAKIYNETITNPLVVLPKWTDINQHVFHLYVIRVKNRDNFIVKLKEKGIETLIHYPIAPHKQEAFLAYRDLKLPLSEQLHEEVLSLPMSSVMTLEQVMKVVEVINGLSY